MTDMTAWLRRGGAGLCGLTLVAAGMTAASRRVDAATGTQAAPLSTPELSPDQAFVTAAYTDLIGRAPTAAQLASATSTSLSSASARARVLGGLAASPQWLTTTVDTLYRNVFGREGDAAGVRYWVERLASHRTTVALLAANFYSSPEYFASHGSNLRAWVAALYDSVLHREASADPAGVAYWTNTAETHGRATVAYTIYQSSESCHTRVKRLYAQLLGRLPDQSGWDFWAGHVKRSGELSVAAALGAGNEYFASAANRLIATHGWHTLANPQPLTYQGTAASTSVVAVSHEGEIVGNTVFNNVSHGLTWSTVSATPTLLDMPAGFTETKVSGVGIDGEIYGYGATDAMHTQALLWPSAHAPAIVLPSPPGYEQLQVNGVSADGVIVGTAYDNDSSFAKGVVWQSPSSPPHLLASFVNHGHTRLTGESPGGMIVGDDEDGSLTWASPFSQPTPIRSQFYEFCGPLGVSAFGTTFARCSDTLTRWQDGVIWPVGVSEGTALPNPEHYLVDSMGGESGTGVIAGTLGYVDYQVLIWPSATSNPIVLPLPDGVTSMNAVDLSIDGIVTGSTTDAQGTVRLFTSST